MTWNLWWRFGPWDQRRPLIVDTIRTQEPDVLCLQEVWSEPDRDLADELADELGFHAARTEAVFWNGESFGNAILSRWPLVQIADEVLPRPDRSPSHRRIVAARADTPWGSWPFASTHLDHRFDRSATRTAQLHAAMEMATGWRGDPERDLPLVIGADLNAVPDSDEVRMVTGRSPGADGIVFSDVWEQVGDGPGHTWLRENPYSSDSAWPDRRLDYLLVSWPRPKPTGNPIRAWLSGRPEPATSIDAVWPSDHLAVVAELVTPD